MQSANTAGFSMRTTMWTIHTTHIGSVVFHQPLLPIPTWLQSGRLLLRKSMTISTWLPGLMEGMYSTGHLRSTDWPAMRGDDGSESSSGYGRRGRGFRRSPSRNLCSDLMLPDGRSALKTVPERDGRSSLFRSGSEPGAVESPVQTQLSCPYQPSNVRARSVAGTTFTMRLT